MELQVTLDSLLKLREQLSNLPEEELSGPKVVELLCELRCLLASLASEPVVDKSRLANLDAFVASRVRLDPMVRKVLLGLITKLANNPSPSAKPEPNLASLIGRIPGLREALEEKQESASKDQEGSEPLAVVPSELTKCEVTGAVQETVAASIGRPGFDTRQLLGFFLQEAVEQVETLSNGLLELEKDGDRLDLVDELFRTVHTLKGASGTMGFNRIVRIAHLAEDVLDGLRQGQFRVSQELIDILLGVADRVKTILAEINLGSEGTTPVEDLVRRLEIFLGKADPATAKTQPVPAKPGDALSRELNEQVINVAEVVKQQDEPQAQPVRIPPLPAPFRHQTVRVPAKKLDDLLNLVGEMVIARTRLVVLGDDLKLFQPRNETVKALNETTVYLGRLMNELQESVMAMRMIPIGYVFSRFPRMVRDLARNTGKEVELVWFGEETELDKTIVQDIGDPLMHILRNCVDHGIETRAERIAAGKSPVGKVTIEAFHEGSHIIITVTDDGKGIDINRVKAKALARNYISPSDELSDKEGANLIFLPGLSTAEVVTDVSGRGVGMDVVKKAFINLGGMIDIDTTPGKGTTFTMRLPLTLAIIQALMVDVGSETYAIPLASVLETLRISKSELKSVGGYPIIQLRGNTLPLISLRQHLELGDREQESNILYVVVVGFGEKRLGLIVDDLHGQQEIVIKPLGDILADVPGFSGATISGEGRVTLILDIGSLINDTLVINRV